MTIEAGRNLLHYRIVDKIGEGGMGAVWRAVDTTLDREVAIKVLPEAFAQDAERLARFEREARTLATLNHSGIAVIHGLHEAEGVRFLAMELVGGEDLSDRIARGVIPLREALEIAQQLAEACEAAHERGVIHRDLKPANIRIDAEEKIKVLDFGLAKAFESGDGSSSPTESPTITSQGTATGVILGTAAYMSAEQAAGRPVDKRADIWAFGCVLYEMLTGRRPFPGGTVTETLASVLRDEPDWSPLPADTPPSIRRLLRRCLDKDPRRRLRDIGDARIVIGETLGGGTEEAADPGASDLTATRAALFVRLLPWAIATVLAVVLLWSLNTRHDKVPSVAGATGPVRLSMVVGQDAKISLTNHDYEVMPSMAIAPSGDRVVYVAVDEIEGTSIAGGRRILRSRSLHGFSTEVLDGTGDAEVPFFSPDGSWIGFFAGNRLMKVPASGGAAVRVAGLAGPGVGGAWGANGSIVFSQAYVGPLWVVPADGGEPRSLTTMTEGERNHRFPQILPDGKSVLFTIKLAGILSFDDAAIAVADLETGEHRVLIEGGMTARYVESGHIVYGRDGKLLAAPFDLDRLTITGGAVPVLDGVFTNPTTGAALYDVAPDGTLAFVPGSFGSGPTTLVRMDRESGDREELAVGYPVAAPHLSPDDRRLVLHGIAAHDQVLVLDLERGTVARMSDASANTVLPIWGPGGEGVVFSVDRSGSETIVWMPEDGGPVRTLVEACGAPQDGGAWSPDGRLMAFQRGPRDARDIWVLDRESGGPPEPFLESAAYEGEAEFSPDGRWIAYTLDETGTREAYASPYPGPGGKIQFSKGGGFQPRWRADGRELYYRTETAVFVVPVTWEPGPRPGRPRKLFDVVTGDFGYDVTADGRWFYLVELDYDVWRGARIDVVLNWFDELERLTGGGGH